jgi:hypothetical protein
MPVVMTQPPADFRCFVTGRTGKGKSHWTRKFLRPFVRVIVWDPKNEYTDSINGRRLTPDEFTNCSTDVLRHGVCRLSVGPPFTDAMFEEDLGPMFDDVCRKVWEIGCVCFVVDEIHLVGSANYCPVPFKNIIAVGRERGISVITVGQRAAQFPKIVTSQANRGIVFQQTEPKDIAEIEDRFQGDWEVPNPRRLAKYHYIDWNEDTGPRICKPVK